MKYTWHSGDTLESVAIRAGTGIEVILGLNPHLDDPTDIATGDELELPDEEELFADVSLDWTLDLSGLEARIEDFVDREYGRSGARFDGVSKEELTAECLARKDRWQVEKAYQRVAAVGSQEHVPDNKWDTAADRLVAPLGLTGTGLALLSLVALVLGALDQFDIWDVPWRFVVYPAIALGATAVSIVGLIIVFLWLSGRVDKVFLERSRWAPRLRDFETALQVFVMEPALRAAIHVEFLPPAEDVIQVESNRLTTTPLTDQLVRTATYRRILLRLARPDGATIGIRGSRGAGKTDLMRSFCDLGQHRSSTVAAAGADVSPGDDWSVDGDGDPSIEDAEDNEGATKAGDAGEDAIGVFIPAPTSLDEFAFLRRVALLICERTLEEHGTRTTSPRLIRWRFVLPWLALAVVGLFIVVSPQRWIPSIDLGWLLLLAGLGGFLVAYAYDILRYRSKRTFSKSGSDSQTTDELRKRAREQAADLQRRLRYTSTRTQDAEGGIDFHGITGKVASSVTRTEIPFTKDDIVEEMSKVISRLNEAGLRVVIGIDELDKLEVDDERTAKLLNALKSLFAITSASFLISISTSAWTAFEQRGLHIRTVFDSSFDDVIEARAFSFLDARSLFKRREVQLSDSQIMFVNVAAGGIARDLVRHARQLAEIGEADGLDLTLAEAAPIFIEQERHAKLEAAILDARARLGPLDAESLIGRLELLARSWEELDEVALLSKLNDLCMELGSTPEEAEVDALAPAKGKKTNDDEDGEQEAAAKARQYLVDAEARVVAYFSFLRLLGRAFAEDGPIQILAQQGKQRYTEMPPGVDGQPDPGEVVEALEELREARQRLELGRTASRFYLADAEAALNRVSGGG